MGVQLTRDMAAMPSDMSSMAWARSLVEPDMLCSVDGARSFLERPGLKGSLLACLLLVSSVDGFLISLLFGNVFPLTTTDDQ